MKTRNGEVNVGDIDVKPGQLWQDSAGFLITVICNAPSTADHIPRVFCHVVPPNGKGKRHNISVPAFRGVTLLDGER